MTIKYLLVFLLIEKISCFNLDVHFPIVYVDVLKSSSNVNLFGYSLALNPAKTTGESWIQIGSPKANDPGAVHRNAGVVYRCKIGKTCRIERFDTGDSSKLPRKFNLTDGWLGASVDIDIQQNRIVTCGYRWSRNAEPNRLLGACYWSNLNESAYTRLIPLDNVNLEVKDKAYYYGQGEAGFSVHIPKGKEECLLGAPGVFNWCGTVARYKDEFYDSPVASRLTSERHKRAVTAAEFANLNIAKSIFTPYSESFDYFGYSVTSGYYFSRTKLVYASGAPRANTYKGKVLLYTFRQKSDDFLTIVDTKIGTQLGEYFGAALSSGDINGDGYDDIIIGAPFFSGQTYNVGRIYVYIGNNGRSELLKVPEQGSIILGTTTNGQFGTTIMYLGDLNSDGFGDVAISAPYENGNVGTVYIYRGKKQGLDPVPSQKIFGKDISEEIRGFGISISRPADIDYNRYDDLAIGSHLSGHAVLLRTRPIVRIQHSFEPLVKYLEQNATSLVFRACYVYTHFYDTTEPITVTRTVTVDELLGRAFFQDSSLKSADVNLIMNDQICENITLSIKDSKNDFEPITATLSYKLKERLKTKKVIYVLKDRIQGTDDFCVRCPILDNVGSSKPVTRQVPFALHCGEDNICNTRLEILPGIDGISDNTFTLGSTNYLTLKAKILNKGEKAYAAQMKVTLPEGVTLGQIPPTCVEQNASVVLCDVDNPLQENKEKTVELDLDMKVVNSGTYDNLTFYFMALTSSNNENTDITTLAIKLVREADITIFGNSGEQSYYYGHITHGAANFSQIYQVEKIGASTIDSVKVTINIPYAYQTEDGEIIFNRIYPPEGNFAGQPIHCRSDFTYLVNTIDFKPNENIESQDGMANSRKRRQTVSESENITDLHPSKLESNESTIALNRTFVLNCDIEEVKCSAIVCTTGPFERRSNTAVFQIKMLMNVSSLAGVLGKKDIISYSSEGSVIIESPSNFIESGNRQNTFTVTSLFVGESVKEKIQIWIIIVAVIAGLILLAIVIAGLIKVGFFKRAKKEELELLKSEEAEYNKLQEEQHEQTTEEKCAD